MPTLTTEIDKCHFLKLKEGQQVIFPSSVCESVPKGKIIRFYQRHSQRDYVDAIFVPCWRWWLVKLKPTVPH